MGRVYYLYLFYVWQQKIMWTALLGIQLFYSMWISEVSKLVWTPTWRNDVMNM